MISKYSYSMIAPQNLSASMDVMRRLRYAQSALLIILALSVVSLLTACGGCREANNAWERARAAPSSVKPGPHWMLEVQTQAVTQRFSSIKERVNKKPAKLKVDSPIRGLSLDAIKFKLSNFKWVVGPKRGVLNVTVAMLMSGKELLKLNLQGRSPLKIDLKAKKMRLQIRADQFDKASFVLGDDAQKLIQKALKRQVPRELRRFVPQRELIKLTKRVLKLINKRGYPIVRDKILAPLGTLVSLSWDLPDYPITRVAVNVTDEAWRIGLWTGLRANGLGKRALELGVGLKRSEQRSTGARLYISSPWLASAGNWAMKKGKIPSRYDRSGKPSKNGSARAALTWGSGKRPLKVHLWTGGRGQLKLCLYARAGINPNLEIKGGELKVSAKGKLERVKGNPLAKTAVQLSGISEHVLQWHHDTSAPTKMNVAGSTIPFTWAHVHLNRDFMMVGIDLGENDARVSVPRSEESPIIARR